MTRWIGTARTAALVVAVGAGSALAQAPAGTAAPAAVAQSGNVIFFHPDGAGVNHWGAARIAFAGPDGELNWDRLPSIGVYTGHMTDRLTGTSNGGATVHAYGVKVAADSFGKNGTGPVMRADGQPATSIARDALAAGKALALVQSGAIYEPGTAAFVASVDDRDDTAAIAQQVIESGAAVIMAGGEAVLLPEGVEGRHGMGTRTDGLDLIARARERGYTVVYTRDELMALDPAATDRVLGVFAEVHTFNDQPFERNAIDGLPTYVETAPTIGEMTEVALQIVSRDPEGFLAVVEEEGTDNLANNMNAAGSLEALRRADLAIGVMRDFVAANPETLLVTTADSEAGGMQVVSGSLAAGEGAAVASTTDGGGILHGQTGYLGNVFMSAPDAQGVRLPFAIAWIGENDVAGGILVRAEGLNADRVTPLMDNTDVNALMRETLFGATSN